MSFKKLLTIALALFSGISNLWPKKAPFPENLPYFICTDDALCFDAKTNFHEMKKVETAFNFEIMTNSQFLSQFNQKRAQHDFLLPEIINDCNAPHNQRSITRCEPW